jgi:hypothetical protein
MEKTVNALYPIDVFVDQQPYFSYPSLYNVSNNLSFYSIFLGLPGLGVLVSIGALLSLAAARMAG